MLDWLRNTSLGSDKDKSEDGGDDDKEENDGEKFVEVTRNKTMRGASTPVACDWLN